MSKPRSHAVDNLRTSLTVLVILHHAVVPYGGAGTWLYASPHYAPGSSIPLLAFNVINQTFFMATFFLISAYFSSISARKRTRSAFLLEKWKRLGIPTVLYSLLSKGLIRAIIAWRSHAVGWSIIEKEFVEGLKSVRGVKGPVWYCSLLLIFDALYTIIRPSHFARSFAPESASSTIPKPIQRTPLLQPSNHEPSSQQQLSTLSDEQHLIHILHVITLLCITALSSFASRFSYPIGVDFEPLCLQLGFALQYVLYYVVGILIHRSGHSLERAVSTRTLHIVGVLAASITCYGLVMVKRIFEAGLSSIDIAELARGGTNTFAILYAFWNEFTGFVLAVLLLRAFSSPRLAFLSNRWTIVGVDVAKYSYAAFPVHTPLLVDLQCWIGRGDLERKVAVLVAVVVGALSVMESWVAGVLLKECVDGLGWRGYV